MPTVKVHAPELAGSTGLKLWIYSASAAALLNAGGDDLTESANGLFAATVAENWESLQRADIKDSNGLVLRSGWLAVGATEVHPRFVGADDDTLEGLSDQLASSSPTLMVMTTIATLTSQTVFTLTAGSADNDVYNGQLVVFTDASTSTQKAQAVVYDYVGSTRTVTLRTAPGFTIAAGDQIAIIAVGPLNPAVTLTLGATVPMTVGELTGFDEAIVIGDDYTSTVGRRITVTLTDEDGEPIAVTFGAKSLADADCSIRMLFHPEGKPTVRAAITGTCEFVAASGDDPAYLLVSLPRTETAKASPEVYQTQVEARWDDGSNVTLAWRGTATFARDIQRRS